MSATGTTVAKDQIDLVLQRIRDPGGLGLTRPTMLALLQRCQTHVNAITPGYVVEVPYTLPTQRALVNIAEFDGTMNVQNPLCLRVLRITHEGRDLTPTTWRMQQLADPTWLRAVAGNLQSWGRLGHDLIFFAPARKAPSLVTIVYAAVPGPLGSEDDVIDLRDDRLPAVAALAETLALLRQRDAAGIDSALDRMATALGRIPSAGGSSL